MQEIPLEELYYVLNQIQDYFFLNLPIKQLPLVGSDDMIVRSHPQEELEGEPER